MSDYSNYDITMTDDKHKTHPVGLNDQLIVLLTKHRTKQLSIIDIKHQPTSLIPEVRSSSPITNIKSPFSLLVRVIQNEQENEWGLCTDVNSNCSLKDLREKFASELEDYNPNYCFLTTSRKIISQPQEDNHKITDCLISVSPDNYKIFLKEPIQKKISVWVDNNDTQSVCMIEDTKVLSEVRLALKDQLEDVPEIFFFINISTKNIININEEPNVLLVQCILDDKLYLSTKQEETVEIGIYVQGTEELLAIVNLTKDSIKVLTLSELRNLIKVESLNDYRFLLVSSPTIVNKLQETKEKNLFHVSDILITQSSKIYVRKK